LSLGGVAIVADVVVADEMVADEMVADEMVAMSSDDGTCSEVSFRAATSGASADG
jgi:hypothetical protein